MKADCTHSVVCELAGQNGQCPCEYQARPSSVCSDALFSALTDDELSALICACQLAEDLEQRGKRVRPPWGRAGTPAHRKLIATEFARAENDRTHVSTGAEKREGT